MRNVTFRLKLAVALSIFLFGTSAMAAPPGDSRNSDVGKKLFSFNVLAVPQRIGVRVIPPVPTQDIGSFFKELSQGLLDRFCGRLTRMLRKTSKSLTVMGPMTAQGLSS